VPFFNREKEVAGLKSILSGEPNVIWFVYGPINSGKTALITKVLEELPDGYCVFYINFRGVETRRYEDFVRALFQPRDESFWEKLVKKADIIEAALDYGEKIIKKINHHFEVPTRVLKLLFQREPERDVFKYLEVLMKRLNDKGKKPVLIFDELQMLREVKKNGNVLYDLFNFLIRITKEIHLCHCLCATSDCLFIEDIYSNARLGGRANYFLVDDLSKEEAFKVYEGFGFREKDLIWEYIGGKLGDMVLFLEEKKLGFSEKEILKKMVKSTLNKLDWIRLTKIKKLEDGESYLKFLKKFKNKEKMDKREVEEEFDKLIYWVKENVLFYNPLEGTVKTQSRLIFHAIKEL